MSRKQRKSERPSVVAVASSATARAEAMPPTPVHDESKSGRAHFVRHKYNALGELAE